MPILLLGVGQKGGRPGATMLLTTITTSSKISAMNSIMVVRLLINIAVRVQSTILEALPDYDL